MQEKILLHFHMFKNGGSTLDWILKRNFGDNFLELHGPNANSTLHVSDCLEATNGHSELRAISSHHLRLPIDAEREDVFPLLIMRHPIDRVVSIFEHERRQQGVSPSDSKFTSLANWLDWTITNRPYMVCDTQAVFFADGGTYYGVPDHTVVRRAIQILASLPFVGTVNHYSESMLVLENMVHEWNPGFDASYFPQNVSVGRYAPLENRLESIRDEIGSILYDLLLMNNSYDIELFNFVSSKLFSQLEFIDDWKSKLHNLKFRCDALR